MEDLFFDSVLLAAYLKLSTKLQLDKKICENVMFNKPVTLKTFVTRIEFEVFPL